MLNIMTRAVVATLLGVSALPAGAAPVATVSARPLIAQGETGLLQLAQLRERRDLRGAQRDVRHARGDLRDARRDLRDIRQDRRYYVRDGRRFYRGPNGAEIFAGFVAGALAAGAAAAAQGADAVAYCESRFRSFDRASGTYLGYDGRRHPCP